MRDSEVEARQVDLETRVAFQDELLATLDRNCTSLGDEVARLRKLCTDMRASLESIRVALGPDTSDEPPPPHY
jgi:SlyX protein